MHLTLPAIAIAAGSSALLGPLPLALVAGLVAGYLGYELLHVAAHVLPDDHPLPAVQRWHLAHHRDARRAFGITSPAWDHAFGTTLVPGALAAGLLALGRAIPQARGVEIGARRGVLVAGRLRALLRGLPWRRGDCDRSSRGGCITDRRRTTLAAPPLACPAACGEPLSTPVELLA